MPDPITPENLYGPSNPPAPEAPAPIPTSAPTPVVPPIPIEETPEIPMPAQTTLPPEPRKNSFGSFIGALILFVGLFGLGIWLSSFIRQYLPGGLPRVGTTPTGAPAAIVTPTPADPFATWMTHQVISSATKLPIEGISFKLPADVLAPICDATSCMSQGTYLPGGTRFTVAPRGAGQMLADHRGSAISDGGGIVFTSTDTTVVGRKAKLFTGLFTGKTVAGYGFSQMRGYMIEVTPTLSLEMNHFTPTGIVADFATDDTLFDRIVSTLVLPGTPSATMQITPTVTTPTIATSAPSPATTSGF